MKEKTIISHQNDGLTFLEIRSEEQFINNVQDVLDLFGELFFRSSPTIAFGLSLSATGRNIRAVASKPLSPRATKARR